MVALIIDPVLEQAIIAQRQANGTDKYDEVWEGMYVMSPLANNEHQELVGQLNAILGETLGWGQLGRTFPGGNISDRATNWEWNFRCPDVLLFLNGNPAEDRGTHWFGGPDLAIEIASKSDRSYEKLPFYASLNTREVLIIEREPWELVLFGLQDGVMKEVARATDQGGRVECSVVPLNLQLRQATLTQTSVLVQNRNTGREWTILGSVMK